jgi:ABC-type transport system involved in cytochrome c biogenesis permease subunit
MLELKLLWAALLAYVIAGSIGIVAVLLRKQPERTVLGLIVLGLVLHTWSIGMLAFAIAYWRVPPIRSSAAVVMPVLFMVMGWLLMTNPGEGHLPPTYHTLWLYIHIGFGKVFFGAVLVALGVSGVILARRTAFGASRFLRLPPDRNLSELSFRCMAIGFVFETLMLIAGAIWAQDAWGRYWAWDPLETWAFLTWLVLAFSLHARFTLKLSPRAGSWLVLAVFVIAFLTFFGVPFISTSAHKGAV